MSNKNHGYREYKNYWNSQGNYNQAGKWDNKKVLKISISVKYQEDLRSLDFTPHSLRIINNDMHIKIKIPYSYENINDFFMKSIELLGLKKEWIKNISIVNSNCLN